jgi:hypothetical protein
MRISRRIGLPIAATACLASTCAFDHAAGANDPPTNQGWDRVYAGTLGGQPIVAEFFQRGPDASPYQRGAIFYYRRHTTPLALVPDPTSSRWFECPYDIGAFPLNVCDAPSGVWVIAITPGSIRGTWRAASGASTAKLIALTRHDGGRRKTGGPNESSGMFYALLEADQRRNIATEAARHGVAWRIEQVSRKGTRRQYDGYVATVQLTQAPNADARNRINAALRARARPDAQEALDESKVSVLFGNSRLFAVGFTDYLSGGAHPTNGFDAVTFDLRTGKPIVWSEIVRVADVLPGKLRDLRKAPLDLRRRDVLAAYVLRKAMADPGCVAAVAKVYDCTDDVCAGVDSAENLYWNIWPTSKGLAVAPDVYSETERGCRGEPVVIPWSDVRETRIGGIELP